MKAIIPLLFLSFFQSCSSVANIVKVNHIKSEAENFVTSKEGEEQITPTTATSVVLYGFGVGVIEGAKDAAKAFSELASEDKVQARDSFKPAAPVCKPSKYDIYRNIAKEREYAKCVQEKGTQNCPCDLR